MNNVDSLQIPAQGEVDEQQGIVPQFSALRKGLMGATSSVLIPKYRIRGAQEAQPTSGAVPGYTPGKVR